jgi:hypothetical protein
MILPFRDRAHGGGERHPSQIAVELIRLGDRVAVAFPAGQRSQAFRDLGVAQRCRSYARFPSINSCRVRRAMNEIIAAAVLSV